MSRAVEHYKRTGCIIPGHADEVAAFLAERRRSGEQ